MRSRVIAVLAVLAFGASAFAQVERPKFFVWGAGRPLQGGQFVVAPDLVHMAKVDNATLFLQAGELIESADKAAYDVARNIKVRMLSDPSNPDHLTAAQVCISLNVFGRVGVDCDNAAVRGRQNPPLTGNGTYWTWPLRTFQESDRLPLDRFGLALDTQGAPTNPDGDDALFFFPHPPSGRTYHNPVRLVNATANGPMRLWTQRFCQTYDAVRANGAAYVGPPFSIPHGNPDQPPVELPIPARFYLDNETNLAIGSQRDDNSLWMLRQLAASKDNGTTSPHNYWSNPAYPVPGNEGPGGAPRSMSDLYEAKKLELSQQQPAVLWPTAEQLPVFELGGLDTRFSLGLRSHTDRNRPFMLWYQDICLKAHDAVMQNCFYGVVQAHWPGCKTGNYDDFKTDGVVAPTGWFIDRNGTLANSAAAIRRAG